MKVLYLFFCILILSGCAEIKETGKGFLGVSTKILEEGRAKAISSQINYGYKDCYEKSLKILKKAGPYVYATSKDMIAVYISADDTTPVGIFFKEIDSSNTEVSVSSPSTYGKELLSKILFRELDKSLHPEKYPKEEKPAEKDKTPAPAQAGTKY